MNKRPFISVIISNKNALKWLNKCLLSLKKQTYKNFEVIFVDNTSSDKSVEFVQKKFPWVRLVVNKKDLGYAGANNVGAQHAKGTYLFLMNTDAYLEPWVLQKLTETITKNPKYHLLQINVKKYDKSNIPDKYLIFSMDYFGYPIGTNGKGEIFYSDGSAMVVVRELFLKLGGFDNKYYMYLEDMDFSWRARLVGEQVYFLKDIFLYHNTGGTSLPSVIINHSFTTTYNRRFNAQKNSIRTIIKNYSLINLLWSLPISLLLALGEGILYLVRGNTKGFITLHKAILWNLLNLSNTLKERNKIQRIRKVPDSEIFKYMIMTISKYHSYRSHGIPHLK